VGKLLGSWIDMLEDCRKVFKDKGRRPPDPPKTDALLDEEIDDFLAKITQVIQLLFVIKYFVYRSEYSTEVDKINFRRACVGFSLAVSLMKWSVTIKNHGVRFHFPDFMDEFGNLRQFLEEGIERLHHEICMLVSRHKSTQGNFAKQQECILNDQAVSDAPVVKEFRVELSTARKRNNRGEIVEGKASASEAAAAALQARIAGILASLPPAPVVLEWWELDPPAAGVVAAGAAAAPEGEDDEADDNEDDENEDDAADNNNVDNCDDDDMMLMMM
jgi:hypothetical protein